MAKNVLLGAVGNEDRVFDFVVIEFESAVFE